MSGHYTRRDFLRTAGALAAASGAMEAGVTAQGPLAPRNLRSNAQQLSAADFTYLGCFRCPPYAFFPNRTLENVQAANTAYSSYSPGSAPLASRVVGGERRFFIVGHGGAQNQVIEIALPPTLSPTVNEAPIAETRDYWNGGSGGVYGPGNSRRFSRNWPLGGAEVRTCGLLWDQQREVLWWSIGEVFQTSALGSPCLGYARLTGSTGSPSTPASATAFGPWDLNDTVSNHTAKGMIIELPQEVRPFVGNRRLAMGGAHFHSILGPHDFGPAVIAVDEPTDTSVPVSGTGYPWNSNRQVLSYANILRYGSGSPGSLDERGNYQYLRRAHRPTDYNLLGQFGPFPVVGAGGTTVNSEGGIGFWTHLDVTHGAVWIKTATRQGLVFTGGTMSGRTWYTTSGYVPHDWRPNVSGSGEAVPDMFDYGERLRIGSESYNPAFFIVSVDDLIAGATRGYGHYRQDLTIVRHPKQAPQSTREGTRAWPYGAPVYDSASRRLYVIDPAAWNYGTEAKPAIHCWEVAE